MASLLDAARRWRWPGPTSTASAILQTSAGEFGGVQSAPASAFSPDLLRAAVERRALLGGPRRRWQLGHALPSELGVCESVPDAGLAGPIGVLLRNASGDFAGGLVSLDPPADAGVVSVDAQYGVSLAIGRLGGVLMASDCALPPPERTAESVYASDNWALATAELQDPSCRLGHALLTEGRAWTTTGSALAWAVAVAEPLALGGAAPGSSVDRVSDAGAAPPDAAVQP